MPNRSDGRLKRYSETASTARVLVQAFVGPFVYAVPIVVSLFSPTHTYAQSMIYGPEPFARRSGTPSISVRSFTAPTVDIYTVRITNGTDAQNRVSSGRIDINGVVILSPDDLNQNVDVIERSVKLELDNQLTVRLTSAPGSALTIAIIGHDLPHSPIATRLTLASYLSARNLTAAYSFFGVRLNELRFLDTMPIDTLDLLARALRGCVPTATASRYELCEGEAVDATGTPQIFRFVSAADLEGSWRVIVW